jgi:hypothetical protein
MQLPDKTTQKSFTHAGLFTAAASSPPPPNFSQHEAKPSHQGINLPEIFHGNKTTNREDSNKSLHDRDWNPTTKEKPSPIHLDCHNTTDFSLNDTKKYIDRKQKNRRNG